MTKTRPAKKKLASGMAFHALKLNEQDLQAYSSQREFEVRPATKPWPICDEEAES